MRRMPYAGLTAVIGVIGLWVGGCWTSPPKLPDSGGAGWGNANVSNNTFSFEGIAFSQRASLGKLVNDERAIGRVISLGVSIWQNTDSNTAAPIVSGTVNVDPNDPLTYPSGFPRYLIIPQYDYLDPTPQDPNRNSAVMLTFSQDDPNEDNGNVYVAIRTASRFYPNDPNYPPAGPLLKLTPPDPNRGVVDGVTVEVVATFEQKLGPNGWVYIPTLYPSADGGDAMAAMYALAWDDYTSYFYQMPYSAAFRLADPNLFTPGDPNFVSYQVPDSAFRDSNLPYASAFESFPFWTHSCKVRFSNMTSPAPDPNHGNGYPMFRNLTCVRDPNFAAGPGYAEGDVYEIGVSFSVWKQVISPE
jgi:hypothetical protein